MTQNRTLLLLLFALLFASAGVWVALGEGSGNDETETGVQIAADAGLVEDAPLELDTVDTATPSTSSSDTTSPL
ncbi:MAG: hypothetical protein KDB29_14195, partial [Planctomycetes bacterium]|nr:hypothetical protein [Planctomycetota bacterium]